MPVALPHLAAGLPADRSRLRRRAFVLLCFMWVAAGVARVTLTPAGVRAEYFSTTDWTGTAVRVDVDRAISDSQLARAWRYAVPETFSVEWFGWLYVDRAADYAFTVSELGRAQLHVDSAVVLSSDRDAVSTGVVHLSEGPHAIVVRYAQPGGASHIALSWSHDGGRPEPIPAWRFSTRRVSYAELVAVRWANALWLPLTLALVAILIIILVRSRRQREPVDTFNDGVPRLVSRRSAAALTLFVALAIVHTWPLATAPGTLSRNDNADTVLNEWTLAWVAHEAPRHPLAIFDANIFYPERRALAFSEALLAQSAMAAPILWLGGSPVLAYNVVLLAGFALTGWAMCLVVTTWTESWLSGIAAGAIVAFNAHTLTRLPHVQAQHAEFLPFALLALDSLLRRPRWRTAAWLALWTSLQGFASIYLLVFTVVALAAAAMVRPEDWASDRVVRIAPMLAGAAALTALALVPLLLPYWELHKAGFSRSLDEAAFFAAVPGDYLAGQSRVYARTAHTAALFPGATAVAIATIGLLLGSFRDRRVRMALAFGACGVLLSFGPAVAPGYDVVSSALPLIGAVRVSARFGYLAIVAVAILAGFGIAAITRRLPGMFATATALVLVAAAAVEPLAAPITYTVATQPLSIYRRVDAEAVVVELPFPPPDAPYRNAAYMLNSTLNWRPLVNGYSGFVPPSYVAHYDELKDFPSSESIAALLQIGVTAAFVHRDQLAPAAASRIDADPRLHRVAVEGDIALYRIDRRAAAR